MEGACLAAPASSLHLTINSASVADAASVSGLALVAPSVRAMIGWLAGGGVGGGWTGGVLVQDRSWVYLAGRCGCTAAFWQLQREPADLMAAVTE